MDIKLTTQNHGSNEVYTKGDIEYVPQTVDKMRENVLQRAKQTLKLLKQYEGGKLTSPMAKSGLNCIKIKIGYGSRNAALFEYDDGATERRLNADTVEERRSAAIEIIKNSIDSIKQGGMDKYLSEFLVSRQTRSINGTNAVSQKARKTASYREKTKKTSPVVHLKVVK
jgi:hypothetical protein